jgi:hypothetical protein
LSTGCYADLQPSFANRVVHQPPEDRFFVEFRWRAGAFDYGTERYAISGPKEAQAARLHLEQHFKAFTFSDWRIVHETVRSEDRGWPAE